MSFLTDNAKNGALGQLRGRITHVSTHTALPNATGSNETTGGGYARVTAPPADWSAASGGAFSTLANKTFAGPASSAATYFGVWDTTTFLGAGAITGDVAYNAEGAFVLLSGTAINLNG